MIEPTQNDIGREVIYRDRSGYTMDAAGTITSFNDAYVFVHYHSSTSAATRREDLEWACPTAPESVLDGVADAGRKPRSGLLGDVRGAERKRAKPFTSLSVL
jgi:hypothetical protein